MGEGRRIAKGFIVVGPDGTIHRDSFAEFPEVAPRLFLDRATPRAARWNEWKWKGYRVVPATLVIHDPAAPPQGGEG